MVWIWGSDKECSNAFQSSKRTIKGPQSKSDWVDQSESHQGLKQQEDEWLQHVYAAQCHGPADLAPPTGSQSQPQGTKVSNKWKEWTIFLSSSHMVRLWWCRPLLVIICKQCLQWGLRKLFSSSSMFKMPSAFSSCCCAFAHEGYFFSSTVFSALQGALKHLQSPWKQQTANSKSFYFGAVSFDALIR